MLIGRIGFLDPLNRGNLPPGGHQPSGARRQVRLDETMEFAQFVARDGGVHMVFSVVIHLPIKEPDNRVQGKSPAGAAEIRDVVLQSNMLGVVAKEEEPATIEGRKRNQYRDQPVPGVDRNRDDQPVTDEQDPRPADRPTAIHRGCRRKQCGLPAILELVRHYDSRSHRRCV